MPILSYDEIVKCRIAFKKLDHNNDGSIQVQELRDPLRNLCTPEELDAIIESADADDSGVIDFPEFLRVVQIPFPSIDEHGEQQGTTKTLKDIFPERYFVANELEVSRASSERYYDNVKMAAPKCFFCIPLIHPSTRFSRIWQGVTACAILYATLMTPVLLAFEDQFYGETKQHVLLIDLTANTIFMLDIIIRFCSMYVDDNGDLVTSPKRIAVKYLRTWFFPDMVSSIPLDFILQSDNSSGLLYIKLSRMGKLTRVLRLLRILKILKVIRLVKFYSTFDSLFQKRFSGDKFDEMGSKKYHFIKFVVCALVVAHVAGCLWYALARFHDDVEDTWIASRDILDAEILDQYLHSMYFIITTLTTVGYGDISASTNGEIVCAVFLMMGGVLGYSIAVGIVSAALMQQDQRKTVIAQKMQTLAHFAKENNMDLMEYGKIKRHIQRKYTESLDWLTQLEGPGHIQSLLDDLPVVLRAKLLRHMHHGKHLHLEFFSRYRDVDLFAYIVPLLSNAIFHQNDMIYLRGDYADCMYFLTRGIVVFFVFEDLEGFCEGGEDSSYSPASKSPTSPRGMIWRNFMKDKEYTEIEHAMRALEPFQVVVDGATFGDFEVFLGIPRQQCVRSDISTETLHLHKKDLLRVLAEFPAISERMRADAKHAHHATMRRKIAHARSKGLQISLSGVTYEEYTDIERSATQMIDLERSATQMIERSSTRMSTISSTKNQSMPTLSDAMTGQRQKGERDKSQKMVKDNDINLEDKVKRLEEFVENVPFPSLPRKSPAKEVRALAEQEQHMNCETAPARDTSAPRLLPVSSSSAGGGRGGDNDSMSLAHHFQHVEDRLEFIQAKQEEVIQKQDVMMKQMVEELRKANEAKEQQTSMLKEMMQDRQEMRAALCSMELRVQSLVLRR